MSLDRLSPPLSDGCLKADVRGVGSTPATAKAAAGLAAVGSAKEGSAAVIPSTAGASASPGNLSRSPIPEGLEAGSGRSSRYSSPGVGVAFARLLKLSIGCAILLGSVYLFMRQALPVLIELARPGAVKVEAKDAAVGVQMIRQTRDVVAKHDAHVNHVNAIVEGLETADQTKAAAPVETPPVAPPAPKEPEVKINLKAANRFVGDLPVNGVMGGGNPRIVVNGLLIQVDDVVDWRLGLVFAGVDETRRMLLFRHKDGTIVQRRY